ncbi:MAG: hypothetical protein M9931_05525 [Chitinophagales bacterium]|nr:hypothetical protein [Chitinophagales bacterium]MCO5280502.1 hypothetical protein [Chitinophagales bacterium]OJV26792.1 MAG: hypothetical protein BGO32_08045 [Bacteroidetes bacterium 37-13]HRN94579.1 hypothetical protein [Chitinophagales bacterium]HRP40101.1 hypothetical protein [Chitinophagales bacterium]
MKKLFRPFLMVATVATLFVVSSCTKTCDEGYEGTDCKTLIREKFIGQFKGPETCTIGNDNYTVTVTGASSDLLSIVINNAYNQNFTVTGKVDGSSLTVAEQSVGSVGSKLSGSGSISGDGKTLTFTYTVTPATGTANTCTYVGTRL